MWTNYNKKELILGRETLTLNSHPVQQKRWCTASKKVHQRAQIWTEVLEVPGIMDINYDRAVVERISGSL